MIKWYYKLITLFLIDITLKIIFRGLVSIFYWTGHGSWYLWTMTLLSKTIYVALYSVRSVWVTLLQVNNLVNYSLSSAAPHYHSTILFTYSSFISKPRQLSLPQSLSILNSSAAISISSPKLCCNRRPQVYQWRASSKTIFHNLLESRSRLPFPKHRVRPLLAKPTAAFRNLADGTYTSRTIDATYMIVFFSFQPRACLPATPRTTESRLEKYDFRRNRRGLQNTRIFQHWTRK